MGSPSASHVAPLRLSACPLHLAHVAPLQSLPNPPWEAVPHSPLVYLAQKALKPIAHPQPVLDASVLFVVLCLIAARRQTGVKIGCSGATGAIALEGRGSLSGSSRAEEKGNIEEHTRNLNV